MRQVEHVACMGQMRNTYTIMIRNHLVAAPDVDRRITSIGNSV
jgi:hypothetical protein